MTDSTITVAIITRNRAGSLEKTLQSIAGQTLAPQEVVIVDNGSTDHTREIAERMSKTLPIKYVYEKTIGINAARNTAMANCSSSILAFIDDDAVAEKDWVAKIGETFRKHPEAAAVQGRTGNLHPENIFASLLQFISQDMPKLRDRDGDVVKSPSMVCSMNLAFRMAPVNKAGISFDTAVPRGGDRNFGHQLLRSNMVIIYADEAVNYHDWPTTLQGYISLRKKAGIAKALLKDKFNKTSFAKETRTWGLKKTLGAAWVSTGNFNPMKRIFFLILLLAGKIVSEKAQRDTLSRK